VTRLLAPAKLTVSLAITGVRPDGYHELRAEMVTLDLADELIVEEPGQGLTILAEPHSRAEGLETDASNLVMRALAAAGRVASVQVVKRIPVGGGLGGGSADAGAILRWAGCSDSALAASLGADVPFCVVGGRALVEGIGERVSPLPYERRTFTLCLPPFGVDTAAVYAVWDEHPSDEAPNALTAAAWRVEPRLARWADALGEWSGADPMLAGSGSTLFVEVGPDVVDDEALLRVGSEQGRLLRVETVPQGWDGT
jgi:4-diphosphocytidyl-2-C-methyl-D-erythritol kinase